MLETTEAWRHVLADPTARFFYLDFMVGLLIPIGVTIAHALGLLGRFGRALFWLGFLIGTTWEYGFHLNGPLFSDAPIYLQPVAYPVHPSLQPLVHSFFDGLLLLIGYGLTRLVFRRQAFTRFRWAELGVLVGWGLAQELLVELGATENAAWVYAERWWNPVLFVHQGHPITLAPQLIWVVASVVFYLAGLRLRGRLEPEAMARFVDEDDEPGGTSR